MPLTSADRRHMQLTALLAVVVVLAASGLYLVLQRPTRTLTAYFTSTVGLFENNAVRVLGVPVGDVTEVVPEGTRVRVEMRIDDADLKLPADAMAVVVSPSLVTGRYVQLAPTYSGGPELQSGAVIPVERTGVPLGVDDLSRTATELSAALGPDGVNKEGALSDALDVSAANLDGNGEAINGTIRDLGELSGTLAGSREELFGTITEMQSFTSNLAKNDKDVRELNERLAIVTGILADERGDLSTAVEELSYALGDVQAFVHDNRDVLHSNVDQLNDATEEVVDQKKALKEVMDVAPTALANLIRTYDGASGTLDVRLLLNELTLPLPVLVCEMVERNQIPADIPELPNLGESCGQILGQIEALGGLPTAAEVITALQSGTLPPLPLLAVPTAAGGPPAAATEALRDLPLPGLGGATGTGSPQPPASGSAPPTPGLIPQPPASGTPAPTSATTTPAPTSTEKPDDEKSGGLGDLFGGGN